MYRSFLSIGLLTMTLFSSAQSHVEQVLVLNEGYYDFFGGEGQLVPVTLGSYDPVTGTYQTVATLVGPRFGSDVMVDGSSIYVAADNRILRYDANNYTLLDEAIVVGVRKLAVWNDQLLITRGETGGLDHYFEARDKNDFSLLYSIGPDQGMVYSAEDVLVHGNTAYLAVNNAFDFGNLQARIGSVDLIDQTYGTDLDLGIEGLNPERLMELDGSIYAFSNKDFTGSSISKITNGSIDYVRTVADNSGCSASALVGSKIYYMEYDQEELARFDVGTGNVLDTLMGSPAVYGLIEDPINNVLYATTTDYFSSGELHVLSMDGQLISTVAVSVSPGNIALDIRSSTGVADKHEASFGVYPNPVKDQMSLTGVLPTGITLITIMDALGREVMRERRNFVTGSTTVDISTLGAGAYLLRLNGDQGVRVIKH